MRIIFVPGGGTINNHLSPDSLYRIKQGLNLSRGITADRFFLSGGKTCEGQTRSEAELMSGYLAANNANQVLILDNESIDTWQNVDALFDWLFIELKSHFAAFRLPVELEINVVSDRWHLRRIEYLVDIRLQRYNKSFGNKPIFLYIPSPFHPTTKRFIYEIIAHILTWLDPWGKSWFVRRNRQNRSKS